MNAMMTPNVADDYDDNDDGTLSERCGTDVQLLWSPAKQRKAQLFICTMSQKCQAAKGAKDSLAIASGSGSPGFPRSVFPLLFQDKSVCEKR